MNNWCLLSLIVSPYVKHKLCTFKGQIDNLYKNFALLNCMKVQQSDVNEVSVFMRKCTLALLQ